MGPENQNPLDELQSLDEQIGQTTELAGLKPIFFRLDELSKQHSSDFEVQLAVSEVKQRVVARGTAAEREADEASPVEASDPLFRLRIGRWAMGEGDLAGLVCLRDPRLRLLAFDFDVAELMAVRTAADLAATRTPGRSHIVAFGRSDGAGREPLAVDGLTASILELSDGTRTVWSTPSERCQLRDMLRYQLMPPVKPDLVKVSTKTCFSSGDRIGVRGSCLAS